MSETQSGTILHYLRELSLRGAYRDHSDRQLLERLDAGDQAAFTSLMKRHGRMVWEVCRRTLGDEHDAEDAFQVVFIVLAYKAGSVHRAESLGSWLHGVALRTALNAKRKAARRRKHEQRQAHSLSPKAETRIEWKEVQTLLDEEVQRLPAAYRAVFVLCCMEGKSLADAARELGKTEGAAAVALSRARKRLKQRLTERGVALGSVLGLLALTATEATAAIPAGLFNATIRAVASALTHQAVTVGVVSESVAALAKGMIKEMPHMSMTKLSLVAVALVVTSALAGGTAWYSGSTNAETSATSEPLEMINITRADGVRGEKNIQRIAWGKAVDGIQAGLEVTEGRVCRFGGSVKFVVWFRNVSDKPAKVTYHTDWFYTSAPIVVQADKSVKAVMPSKPDARQLTFELTLKPDEVAPLGPPELAFVPAEDKEEVLKPTVRGKLGAYKVHYEGLSVSHAALTTGQADILVQRGGAAKNKEKSPLAGDALRLAGATWHGKMDRGEGPTYHADGTGRNYDGSKFEWRVEGDYLIVRRLPEQGKPEAWVYIPIVLSRDSMEYRIILDKEYSFFRVSPTTGKPDHKRAEEGRQFPRRWFPEERENDGAVPAPQPVKQAPIRDEVKPAKKKVALHIGPNVHVSKANAEILHAEVVLATDPTDPQRLVAASMYSPPPVDPSAPKIIVYTSTDGGKSWVPTLERMDANPASLADPAFVWGTSDSLFFVNMWAPSLDKQEDAGCLQVVRSQDGGQRWGPTTTIKAYHDRPFLTMDNTGGKYQGRLYCLTHKGLLVSTDAGRSFGPARSWTRRSGYVAYGSCNPVVLSNGTLIAVYNSSQERRTVEQQRRNPAHNQHYLAARVSRDGGDSFSEECVLSEYYGAGYPQATSAPAHSPWRDRVYVVWQETLPTGRSCISYAYSKDRGKTFSKPVILSEQSEDAGDTDAFVPSIAVNKAGAVAVTWYDTRGLRPGEAGWDVRIRASLDGGETWQPSVQVSDAPTRKNKKTGKCVQGVGHTAGLVADADGVFHCLWVNGRSGVSQVYTTAVIVEPREKP